MKQLTILILFCVTAFSSSAGSWQSTGDFKGFTKGSCPSMAVNKKGMPYILFRDAEHGFKATVVGYNGKSWRTVGNPGCSNGALYGLANTAIALDMNDVPYIFFIDSSSGNGVVMRLNGDKWVNVGNPGFTDYGLSSLCISVDKNNTTFVAYMLSTRVIKVMKFSADKWVQAGSEIYGRDILSTSMVLDDEGAPYVTYPLDISLASRAAVRKWINGEWVKPGGVLVSVGGAEHPSIVLNGNNIPFVIFRDNITGGKASVRTLRGDGWVHVGSEGFTANGVWEPEMTLGEAGYIYMVSGTGTSFDAGKVIDLPATAMQYDGKNWSPMGEKSLPRVMYRPSIKFGKKGVVYLLYSKSENDDGIAVMEYK